MSDVLDITADAVLRMEPDYPPIFNATDAAASEGQRRSILTAQFDITIVLAGAVISVLVSFVTPEPYHQILSTAAVVAFVLMWVEKSILPRFGFSRDWFASRAIAEASKSLVWRYMLCTAPFDGTDADHQFLASLRETLREHEITLEHAPSRIDDRQITPYMQLVRALPLEERKRVYLHRRLIDQLNYYTRKAESDARIGARWRIAGMVFRVATLLFAVARFLNDTAGILVGLFVNLTVVVASWSQLLKYDDLAKGYAQVSRSLRRLERELRHAPDDQTVEKLVLEIEGVISHEETVWMLKRS